MERERSLEKERLVRVCLGETKREEGRSLDDCGQQVKRNKNLNERS